MQSKIRRRRNVPWPRFSLRTRVELPSLLKETATDRPASSSSSSGCCKSSQSPNAKSDSNPLASSWDSTDLIHIVITTLIELSEFGLTFYFFI